MNLQVATQKETETKDSHVQESAPDQDISYLMAFFVYYVTYFIQGLTFTISAIFQAERFTGYFQAALCFEAVICFAGVIPTFGTKTITRVTFDSLKVDEVALKSYRNMVIRNQVVGLVVTLLTCLIVLNFLKIDGVAVIDKQFTAGTYLRVIFVAIYESLYEFGNTVCVSQGRNLFCMGRQLAVSSLQIVVEALIYSYVEAQNNWPSAIAYGVAAVMSAIWFSMINRGKTIMGVKIRDSLVSFKEAYTKGSVLKEHLVLYLKQFPTFLMIIACECLFSGFVAFKSLKIEEEEDANQLFFLYVISKPIKYASFAVFEGCALFLPKNLKSGNPDNIVPIVKQLIAHLVCTAVTGWIFGFLLFPKVLTKLDNNMQTILAIVYSGVSIFEMLLYQLCSIYNDLINISILLVSKIVMISLLKGSVTEQVVSTQIAGAVQALVQCIIIYLFRIIGNQKKKAKKVVEKLPFDEDMLVEN